VRLFYLGGLPGSAERAAEAVRERYPGAQVCGAYCPSFEAWGTEAEEARIAAAVREAAPDILLVGLGTPKQEKWIAANKDRLGVPVSIGVGASFEMAGGVVRRAPRWLQRIGMEWSFRLLQEPTRLWRRYMLRDLPCFVGLALRAVASRKSTRSRYSSQPVSTNGTLERLR
jgi:N-acetylglucosaminyldiphosphoundecaprenol N-acetyl-beta-D-mannosaminyltransferase